jgi:hypothetical protein
MSGTLAFLDLLNAREKAIVLWFVALVVFAAIKSDGLGSSFLGVLRALASHKLLLLFGAAAVYSGGLVFFGNGGLVFFGNEVGLWHTSATKATIYWFFGTAVILVGNATQVSPDDPAFIRRLLRGSLKLTILVEFLVNLYVLPMVVELLLVPLPFMLIGTQVVVEHEPNLAPARKVINGVLGAIGVAVTLYLGVRVLGDWSGFWTRKNAEGFLVAPVFTLGLVPFLCLVAWESRRELDNLRKRWSPAADSTAWEH